MQITRLNYQRVTSKQCSRPAVYGFALALISGPVSMLIIKIVPPGLGQTNGLLLIFSPGIISIAFEIAAVIEIVYRHPVVRGAGFAIAGSIVAVLWAWLIVLGSSPC